MFPPEGYRVVPPPEVANSTIARLQANALIRDMTTSAVGNLLPLSIIKPFLQKRRSLRDSFLTFAAGHVVFRDEKWVVDLEMASQLAGYSIWAFRRWRKVIERCLSSSNCIGVLPWTDAGKATILHEIKSPALQEKVHTVHLSCPKRSKCANVDQSGEITYLFVSSVNFPDDFEIKGGKEVVLAFLRLCRTERSVRLVLRSRVPQEYRTLVAGNNRVRLIEENVSWSEMERLFCQASVFLFPGHHTPGKSILDAMSYGLPVVATRLWGTPEMVTPANGILLDPPCGVPYLRDSVHPNWGSAFFRKAISSANPDFVTRLEDAMRLLCRDEGLRERMGSVGLRMVEEGEFSLKRRNAALGEIFSQASS